MGGKLLPRLSRPLVNYAVERARASLSGSLRRMRRERVDILFLHEPRRDLIATDEWLRWMDVERERIGAIGLAGEADRLLPFVREASPLADVMQTRDSLGSQEASPLRAGGGSPQITYGHLARRDPSVPIGELIRNTIERWPDTVLLISTRRAERIRELAQLAVASSGGRGPKSS
jgi:D-threo-aldose 1-dehydrogenase